MNTQAQIGARPRLATRKDMREAEILPRRVLVLVRRDMAEEIPSTVFEHEVDILAEVHGEGNVTIAKDPLDYGILIGDPDTLARGRAEMFKAAKENRPVPAFVFVPLYPVRADGDGHVVPAPVRAGDEMQRLRGCYGMHPTKPEYSADVAYPSERDLIAACGGVYEEHEQPTVKNAK